MISIKKLTYHFVLLTFMKTSHFFNFINMLPLAHKRYISILRKHPQNLSKVSKQTFFSVVIFPFDVPPSYTLLICGPPPHI